MFSSYLQASTSDNYFHRLFKESIERSNSFNYVSIYLRNVTLLIMRCPSVEYVDNSPANRLRKSVNRQMSIIMMNE